MYLLPLHWAFAIILISETIVLYYLQKNITIKWAISVVFISNIVSMVLGFFILILLLTVFFGDGREEGSGAAIAIGIAIFSVPATYILNVLIEYMVLRLIKNFDKPFLYSLLMNTTSYAFIIAFII